ncbi:MAG: O-antigen ligase family protein [Anaerolineae bacterium]
MEAKRSQPLLILVGVIFYLVCLAFLGWLGLKVIGSHRYLHQGVLYGEPPDIPLAYVYPLGVNASLERYETEEDLRRALEYARDGGFLWIRQRFPWAQIEPERGVYSWEKWDKIVALTEEYGLTLIAVLDTSPPWARAPMDGDNLYAAPRDFADYEGFVRNFADRYKDSIDFYEIWDEPNIYPHWGERYVQPIGYVHLLQGAYGAIKGADPDAFVLSAGLAPNVEPGGRNMSDLLFLQEMYEAGAKRYFDILAIKPYGFWSGPEDRRLDPGVTNFSRAVLLRQVMLRNGDNKAVWAVEFGWNSLPLDWAGKPPPWGSDTEEVQARRTVEAMERALDEWPWMGALVLMHLQPDAPPDDPVHGFALLNEDFSPRLTYQEVARWAEGGVPAHPGRYPANSWAAQYEGEWERDGLSIIEGPGSLEFSFVGTGLDMVLTDPFTVAQVTIDGREVEFRTGKRSMMALPLEEKSADYLRMIRSQRVVLARGLSHGFHTLRLITDSGSDGAIMLFIVRRDADFKAYYLSLALLAGVATVISWRLGRLLLLDPSQRVWRRLANLYLGLAEWPQIGLLALALGAYWFSPWTLLSLVALAMVAAFLYLRLDLGLAFIALSIPFFLYPKPLLGKAFSLVETLTLISFLLWFLKMTIGSWSEALRRYKKDSSFELQEVPWGVWLLRELPSFVPYWARDLWRCLTMLDLGVLFFLLLSLFSLTVSENFGVSAREFRVVVLESALFYLLLREVPQHKGELWRIVDGLVAAALIVSLYGLFQYFFTADVIAVEGVRRIRGVYGSPNNLSLFLGRVLPLTLAVSLFGAAKHRRLAYGAASLPMLVCLFLSFSRGAWLLGVPAAVLFLGLMRGRRAFWVALGGVGAAILALLPLAGLERLTSLLSLQEGTTQRRLALWKAALQMIRDHPLFGVGLDNFLYQYPRYMLPEAWQEPDLSHPHNLILDWWTRLGVLGVVALIWLEVAFFKVALRLYRSLEDEGMRVLSLGLMASMVDFLAHGLVDNSYFLVDLAFIFCLTLGIVRRMEIFERREV